jgi:lycopene beta-cyclase
MAGQNLDSTARSFDYALVGAGLSNCLVALALARHQPAARIVLIDAAKEIGAEHTWSFHETDVSAEDLNWLSELSEHRAESHEVRFQHYSRTLNSAYFTITGERLRRVVTACFDAHPNFELLLGSRVEKVAAQQVQLASGERLDAKLVIDARGPELLRADVAGYQKFLGLLLEWDEPHGIERAILMDAEVEQLDGFRFVYVLPFGPRRALVEDTYFSDGAQLNRELLRERVLAYVALQGLPKPSVVREEVGVLPLPRRLRFASSESPLAAGYGGGFLHPTTGYSLPIAVRLANFIARRAPEQLFGADFEKFSSEHRRQARFAELLNRLLFQGFAGEKRHAVFERFYRLPEPTIARFYALQTTPLDRTRILCGRPPRGISLKRALFGGLHS